MLGPVLTRLLLLRTTETDRASGADDLRSPQVDKFRGIDLLPGHATVQATSAGCRLPIVPGGELPCQVE